MAIAGGAGRNGKQMTKITLTNHMQMNMTMIDNSFIDQYMAEANGEYVKVYLLLLRYNREMEKSVLISKIADKLELTEKDVVRALNYWEKQGLLCCESVENVAPAAFPLESEKENVQVGNDRKGDVSDLQSFKSRKEFKQLLFVAEQYLGKTLCSTEVDAIVYFYETLDMSADLIEYLIEYCVENGHKSIHYIQKVAVSWHEKGIHSVEEAKQNTILYNKTYYSVLNAYGIKGRAPAASEIVFIRKWIEQFGFSLEMVLEACGRTMSAIHQPSFEYTDSILKSWNEKGLKNLTEVAKEDASFLKEKDQKTKERKKHAVHTIKGIGKFHNFEHRNYDMNDLERKLVQQ